MRQQKLNLDKGRHGGRRSGSGRKRIHSKGVSHREREKVNHRTPCHVNFKYNTQIRNKDSLKLLKRAIVNARRFGLKIIHFSLQHNHIHLIIEPTNNKILTKGMRSLTITFAKGLNKRKVQIERYHLHVLRSVRETRNAIYYVLFNKQRHEKGTCSTLDEYCSIWSAKNATEIIKRFVTNSKITLKITHKSAWEGDKPSTYVLKASLLTQT